MLLEQPFGGCLGSAIGFADVVSSNPTCGNFFQQFCEFGAFNYQLLQNLQLVSKFLHNKENIVRDKITVCFEMRVIGEV